MPIRLLTIILFLTTCTPAPEKQISRAFYHWKTRVAITPGEQQQLDSLGVHRLFVKFFDVDRDDFTGQVLPQAKVLFPSEGPGSYEITPVVYITQEALYALDSLGVDSLAGRIADLLESLSVPVSRQLSREVQLDCDWSAQTRDRYFRLLEKIRRYPFFQKKTLSVTIRLHQLKYITVNGIPPADRGLLMSYNMGNLRHPETRNSILDTDILQQYVRHLSDYPLPVDIALPLFEWWVWFRKDQYKGLVRTQTIPVNERQQEKIRFDQQTIWNGYTFEPGDWLRHEQSSYPTLLEAARILNRRSNTRDFTVILYHLDSATLSNYRTHELETVYRRFR